MSQEEILSHPLLRKYSLSERRAILVHKYFLGLELKHDPGLAAAIESWEQRITQGWHREKMRLDAEKQLAEIEKHKYLLSQQRGYNVGWEEAARDWITRYADVWRTWWEMQPESNP